MSKSATSINSYNMQAKEEAEAKAASIAAQQAAGATIGRAYEGRLNESLYGAMNGREAPLAGYSSIDQTQSNEARGGLMDLASQLKARANGTGAPSLAELQMKQGMDSAINTQRSQAASARGLSPGMAQRMAANGIADAQMDTANNTSMLRAAEQSQAQGALGQLLSGVRGQDAGLATSQAGLNQGVNLANQQSQIQTQGQIDAATQAYLGMGMGRETDQVTAYNDMAATQAAERTAAAQIAAEAEQAKKDRENKTATTVIGGLLSAAGSGGAALTSDKRLKEDISSADKMSDEFLDGLKAYSFKYKGNKTKHLGVMAQDVEKTAGGKGMVREEAIGKVIDVPQAVGRLLATSASMHRRLRAVEGK
jgi:hypothetical protein